MNECHVPSTEQQLRNYVLEVENVEGTLTFYKNMRLNAELLNPPFVVTEEKFRNVIPYFDLYKDHWIANNVLGFSVQIDEYGGLNGFYHNFYDFMKVIIYQELESNLPHKDALNASGMIVDDIASIFDLDSYSDFGSDFGSDFEFLSSENYTQYELNFTPAFGKMNDVSWKVLNKVLEYTLEQHNKRKLGRDTITANPKRKSITTQMIETFGWPLLILKYILLVFSLTY